MFSGATQSLDLPEPDSQDRQTSAELSALIREKVRTGGGSISFDAYMEQALYTPGLGYYSSARTRFGAAGDFVTAPEISRLFSRCVAGQAVEVFAAMGSHERRILEAGGGSGVMARDVISAFDDAGEHLDDYLILERSAGARAQQRQTLGAAAQRVQWLDDVPDDGFCGLIVANEVLDAIPAQRFVMGDAGPEELRVVIRDESFDWQPGAFTEACAAAQLDTVLADIGALPLGYVSEFAPARAAWIRTLAERLKAGVLLVFDYGYPRREFYHPQRVRGTLACHYRHRMHEDPFRYPGLQDISVHVDFSAIVEAAHEVDLYLSGYTTQANFLIAAGLLDFAGRESAGSARDQALLSAEIQRLTLPSQLGEAVKVMAMSPDPDMVLSGFAGRDLSRRL